MGILDETIYTKAVHLFHFTSGVINKRIIFMKAAKAASAVMVLFLLFKKSYENFMPSTFNKHIALKNNHTNKQMSR